MYVCLQWTGKHGGIVTCCNYSHDDQYVVSASDLDNVVKIWDVRDGKMAFEIKGWCLMCYNILIREVLLFTWIFTMKCEVIC